MEIKLKDEEWKLKITDEGFDTATMWLRLSFINSNDENIGGIELPHRELMAALIAFDAKQNRFQEEVK